LIPSKQNRTEATRTSVQFKMLGAE